MRMKQVFFLMPNRIVVTFIKCELLVGTDQYTEKSAYNSISEYCPLSKPCACYLRANIFQI